MDRNLSKDLSNPVPEAVRARGGRVCVRVECDPFDRFSPNGTRHAKDFSFRVETPDEVFHWSFLIPTILLMLGSGGFEYDERNVPMAGNWPLFLCSCGDVACGGFGSQSGKMTATKAILAVEYGNRTIEFEFDRLRFEFWSLRMLCRMRGSVRLRRDPWKTLLDRCAFDDALETLLAARPRCRAIWMRLKSARNPAEADFAALAAVPPDEAPDIADPQEFVPCFGLDLEIDLRTPEPLWDERSRILRCMEKETVEMLPCHLYAHLVGRNWEPATLERGRKIAFLLDGRNAAGRPSIRAMDAASGETVGFLKRQEAAVLAAMMERHGLVLENHTEEIGRNGKILPVRIGFSFRDPSDLALDWGGSLSPRERFYFEMLRAVALKPGVASVAVLRGEVENVGRLLSKVADCPEIAFLSEWILAAAREIECRLTAEETAARRAWCDTFRRALACEPAGSLIAAGTISVLPLKAAFADSSIPSDEVIERARSWIRLAWGREETPRPHVALPDFPPDATGFAAFRGRALLDVCLTGVPISGSDLFDNFALYDRPFESLPHTDVSEAFGAVSDFLSALPVRERSADGRPMHYWQECGIHDGKCEIGGDGRLVALRVIQMAARRRWVD